MDTVRKSLREALHKYVHMVDGRYYISVHDFDTYIWRLWPTGTIAAKLREIASLQATQTETGSNIPAMLAHANRESISQLSAADQEEIFASRLDAEDATAEFVPASMADLRTAPSTVSHEQQRELLAMEIRRLEMQTILEGPEEKEKARQHELQMLEKREAAEEKKRANELAAEEKKRANELAAEEKRLAAEASEKDKMRAHELAMKQIDVKASAEEQKRITADLKHKHAKEMLEIRNKARMGLGLRGGGATATATPVEPSPPQEIKTARQLIQAVAPLFLTKTARASASAFILLEDIEEKLNLYMNVIEDGFENSLNVDTKAVDEDLSTMDKNMWPKVVFEELRNAHPTAKMQSVIKPSGLAYTNLCWVAVELKPIIDFSEKTYLQKLQASRRQKEEENRAQKYAIWRDL